MALSAAFENSASISTAEYSLPNNSTTLTPRTEDGVFQAFIDMSNMVAGDQYELKVYEKYASGGTQRLLETWFFEGAQGDPLFVSPPMVFFYGWDFTLKRIAGADRTIYWSIRQAS